MFLLSPGSHGRDDNNIIKSPSSFFYLISRIFVPRPISPGRDNGKRGRKTRHIICLWGVPATCNRPARLFLASHRPTVSMFPAEAPQDGAVPLRRTFRALSGCGRMAEVTWKQGSPQSHRNNVNNSEIMMKTCGEHEAQRWRAYGDWSHATRGISYQAGNIIIRLDLNDSFTDADIWNHMAPRVSPTF